MSAGFTTFTPQSLKEHDEQVRKEERERVLDALWREMFRDNSMRFINDTYRIHNEWYEAIETLRKGDAP